MERDEMIGKVLGPGAPELTCKQCFAELDRYVELALAGEGATSGSRGCAPTSTAAPPAPRTSKACASWSPSRGLTRGGELLRSRAWTIRE
jgi:hypothetical protein